MNHHTFGTIELRDYQDLSIEGLRENIRRGIKNQVLCSPTGSGKTICAAYLLHEAYRKGSRALFIADRIALIDQTSATLDSYGIPHGVIQGNHWRYDPSQNIQVASAATLTRRGWPQADLVIVDESHALIKNTLEKIKDRKFITIGLTATPFSKGMGKYYDAVVTVTTTNRLTQDGFLVPAKFFSASAPDMTGAKVQAGEWTEAECSKRAMPIIGDAVQEYLKHANGKKFIAFGCDVNHCGALQRQFNLAGVVTELYTYQTGDDMRTAIVKEFRKPDSFIRGLVSVSALSKGFDVSDCECIIMCRPLRKSLTEHIQILGRGLRPHPNKTECIVLDHSGNALRFWDEMHEFFENGVTELDDGKPENKAKTKPKERKAVKCPKCFHVHDAMPVCPACGFEYPKRKSVEHEAGELSEIGQLSKATKEDKQAFHAMLNFILDEHNARNEKQWKPGWVAMKYKDKFGVWPKAIDLDLRLEPTHEVRSWLRSSWIRFIKSKAA